MLRPPSARRGWTPSGRDRDDGTGAASGDKLAGAAYARLIWCLDAAIPSASTRRSAPASLRGLRDAERVNELDAEHWIARWEREAELNGPGAGSQGYWDAGWRWIAENRRKL
jgi:hypothetical protein